MTFTPAEEMKKYRRTFPKRHDTTLTCIIGEERKSKFAAYCKKHQTSHTKMICQMIDYCMGDETA